MSRKMLSLTRLCNDSPGETVTYQNIHAYVHFRTYIYVDTCVKIYTNISIIWKLRHKRLRACKHLACASAKWQGPIHRERIHYAVELKAKTTALSFGKDIHDNSIESYMYKPNKMSAVASAWILTACNPSFS